mmetsp:Transcript_99422/g.280549  ORF Transcript_99422/g.280549 Transcript_99422/m.280549 type:complete len:247 (+) Transcript_99422:737-1477(+)
MSCTSAWNLSAFLASSPPASAKRARMCAHCSLSNDAARLEAVAWSTAPKATSFRSELDARCCKRKSAGWLSVRGSKTAKIWPEVQMPLSRSLAKASQHTRTATSLASRKAVCTVAFTTTGAPPACASRASASQARPCSLSSRACPVIAEKRAGNDCCEMSVATSGIYARLPSAATARRCSPRWVGNVAMACVTAAAAATHNGRNCASSRARRPMACRPMRCAWSSPSYSSRNSSTARRLEQSTSWR